MNTNSQKAKAVFLDRDGTINVEKNYLYRIEDFEYLDGVIDGLKLLQDNGYKLVIVTNQSGVARGYYSEEDYYRLDEWLKKDLLDQGITITKSYFCPHHPKAKIEKYRCECDCRKPAIGMFEQAARELNIDLNCSYAIGDKIRDLALCEKYDTKGYLLYSMEEKRDNNIAYITGGILEAAKIILEKEG